MNPLVLIPCRMASTRLPGKPPADPEVAAVVRAAGGTVVMTEPELPSGSDRAHAAVRLLGHRTHDVIINLQGDLPGLPPDDLGQVLVPLDDSGFDIAALLTPITGPEEAAAPSVVKVVRAFAPGAVTAHALYFSRAALAAGGGPLCHHIGVYAYRRDALARFVELDESPLERREMLEQLRPLEAGMRIGCAQLAQAPSGVDTPADPERARKHIAGTPS